MCMQPVNDPQARRCRERLNHSYLQPVKLGKPRMFRESGRATVRKLQYVQGKEIGESESRRTKVKGKIQFVYNPADRHKCANPKGYRLPYGRQHEES